MTQGILRPILLALALLLSVPAHDALGHNAEEINPSTGGMDSGGAGLYGTGMNPWFLENTPKVTFCLDVDPTSFHQSLDVVEQMIQESVNSWRSVFAESESRDPVQVQPFGVLRIATQVFERVGCDRADVDIRFQLGVLTEEQKKIVGSYREWIGFAYRTSYDTKTLRGKGFVYIAADSGPNLPRSNDLVSNLWAVCNGCLLKRAIVHEMGHVFGIGHIGNDWDIMSERHLEKVTSKEAFARQHRTPFDQTIFDAQSSLSGYLTYSKQNLTVDCTSMPNDNRLRQVFGIPQSEKCFGVQRGADYSRSEDDVAFVYGGSLKYNNYFKPNYCKKAGRSEIGWLYLPPDQKTFHFERAAAAPNKMPIATAYERVICTGHVYRSNAMAAEDEKTEILMTITSSRDGATAGSAHAPGFEELLIFSSQNN